MTKNATNDVSIENHNDYIVVSAVRRGRTYKRQIQKLNSQIDYRIPKLANEYVIPQTFFDLACDLQDKRHVCFTGPKGCGKTSQVFYLASLLNQSVERVNLNGGMTIYDFIGTYETDSNKGMKWIDGVLTKAVKNGSWLLIDEMDYGQSDILCRLNALLESDDGRLVLNEKGGEVIIPHPNFRIIATGNTIGAMENSRVMYPNTKKINEALIDRFRIYMVNYLNPSEEVEVGYTHFVKNYLKYNSNNNEKELMNHLDKNQKDIKNMISGMVHGANSVRALFDAQENDIYTFSTRQLIDWIELTVRFENTHLALESSLKGKICQNYFESNFESLCLKLDEKEVESTFLKLKNVNALSREEKDDILEKFISEKISHKKDKSKDEDAKEFFKKLSSMTIDLYEKNLMQHGKEVVINKDFIIESLYNIDNTQYKELSATAMEEISNFQDRDISTEDEMFEISSSFFASILLLKNGHDDVLGSFTKEINKKYANWKKIIENLTNVCKNNVDSNEKKVKKASASKKNSLKSV